MPLEKCLCLILDHTFFILFNESKLYLLCALFFFYFWLKIPETKKAIRILFFVVKSNICWREKNRQERASNTDNRDNNTSIATNNLTFAIHGVLQWLYHRYTTHMF